MLIAVRIWVLLSALLVSAGWILSAFDALNRTGYIVFFSLAAAAVICWWRKTAWRPRQDLATAAHKFFGRFKRAAPRLFLSLALMSFCGGALYVSTDGDAMAYRIPRVLHWLAHEQWHWIHTLDFRMNIAGCGYEWLSTPLILFTSTDRFVFIINWISYLLLPGLLFSVFIRLGVRRGVAWWWMWLVSSGWCYALQAGSTHNDSFATIYALAAVDLALRAKEKKCVTDAWLAMLAAALLTGTKQTCLPLAALWLIATWPNNRLLFSRPKTSGAVVGLSLLVSALPGMIANIQHLGSWGGNPEMLPGNLNSPIWGIMGNSFCLTIQNLLPPFFPWADAWNASMRHFLQTPIGQHFSAFEAFGHVRHSVSDNSAGIGLGIGLLLLISLAAAGWRQRTGVPRAAELSIRAEKPAQVLRLTPWLLLLLFMAKVGTFENARQLSPYYVFLFPALLVMPALEILRRKTWWQWLLLLVMLGTAVMLVTSRSRPLFPAQTLLAHFQNKYPQSERVAKMAKSYALPSAYANNRNLFLKSIPPGESEVGFATTFGGSEVGLWLPLGRPGVERVLPEDNADQLRREQIHYVVVDDLTLIAQEKTLAQWLVQYHGELIDQRAFYEDPYRPPVGLYLVHLL